MSRPLLITDCDEVLLHMVGHFRDYLDEEHGLDFALEHQEFAQAIRRRDGSSLTIEEIWPLFKGFFPGEMHRQTLVPHAREALTEIAKIADIVVLTNLMDDCRQDRITQLEAYDIRHRVVCNQGGKGTPVGALLEEYAPTSTVFVDDLPQHHDSVARRAPDVWRLHMIAEPRLASHIPPAPDAHARIDDWRDALPWIMGKLAHRP
jgi:hypothetical protein